MEVCSPNTRAFWERYRQFLFLSHHSDPIFISLDSLYGRDKSFVAAHQVLIDLTHEDITKGWTQWLVTCMSIYVQHKYTNLLNQQDYNKLGDISKLSPPAGMS